ncbi:putative T7SS-secreted protein [Mobilicoccus sp.]|uniref:putative T7SS-secreted protein n=1 Tax=Mobilicoccus sp. TaxID=2034349 RepID=UPI0028AB97EF|nr:hypothetical protein [Mobilicoccus sp.]
MRPAVDWSPLGWGQDPVPGDPDEVADAARRFGDTARELSEAASRLRGLGEDQLSTEAVTVLLARAHELAGRMEAARTRYDEAEGALARYAPVLRDAQVRSLDAQRVACAAAEAYRQARARAEYDRVELMAPTYGSPAEDYRRQELQESYDRNVTSARSASDELRNARAMLDRAIEDRDAAASLAADTIEAVVDDSPLNDTLGDRIRDVVDRVAESLDDIRLEKIGEILQTASLACTVASLFFPPLAPFAQAVGIAGTVLELVGAGAHSHRTGDWWHTFDVAAGALVSFGVGKAAGGLVSKKVPQFVASGRNGFLKSILVETGPVVHPTASTAPVGAALGVRRAVAVPPPLPRPTARMTAMADVTDVVAGEYVGEPLAHAVVGGVRRLLVRDDQAITRGTTRGAQEVAP